MYTIEMRHQHRWLAHYSNRILYEKTMLEATGGLAGAQHDYAVGGRIKTRFDWHLIKRINKVGGVVNSLSVIAGGTVSIDDVRDYQPPKEGMAEAVKEKTRLAPLCNYPAPGFLEMTTEQFNAEKRHREVSTMTHKATDSHARHRTRCTIRGGWNRVGVFITDAKRKDAPLHEERPNVQGTDTEHADTEHADNEQTDADETYNKETETMEEAENSQAESNSAEPISLNQADKFKLAKESLKKGVQIISVPDLFPTPAWLAERMVAAADIQSFDTILEPSAGSGSILKAAFNAGLDDIHCTAIEVQPALSQYLHSAFPNACVIDDNFLEVCLAREFSVVLMNPPFAKQQDIKHITHALAKLRPGGRLVAICANGPKQNKILRPLVLDAGGTWEELPNDTFKEAGTAVRSVLLTMTR